MRLSLHPIFAACIYLISTCALAQVDVLHYIPPVYAQANLGDLHKLIITTNETDPFDVTVTNGDGSFVRTVTVSANSSQEIDRWVGDQSWIGVIDDVAASNTVTSYHGLIATGDRPFFVNSIHRHKHHGGILTSKGTTGLGTDFYSGHMNTIWTEGSGGQRSHFVAVMATQDNTAITIQNARASFDDQPDTIEITLDAGESYVVAVDVNDADPLLANAYHGTHITSDKPIAVNSGSWLGSGYEGGRDIGIDQLVPVEHAGHDFVVIEGNGGENAPLNETVIIVATAANTEVFLNGSNTAFGSIAQPGDFIIIPRDEFINGAMVVNTTAPVFVFQTLSGANRTPTPGMMFIPRLSECSASSVSIPALPDLGNSSLFLTTQAGSELTINGIVVTNAIALNGNNEWEAYRVTDLTPYETAGGDYMVVSTGALTAATTIESENRGAGAYFSGFATVVGRAGVGHIGELVDTLRCNQPVNLVADGGDFFNWTSPVPSNLNALSATDQAEVVFTPTGEGVYNFSVEITGSCSQEGDAHQFDLQIVVDYLTVDAGEDFSICPGDEVQLYPDASELMTTTAQVDWAVNVGGPAYTSADGIEFEDGTNLGSGQIGFTTNEVGGTADDVIFQTELWGTNLSYSGDLANGDYELTMYFAEFYWDNANERVLNIEVEGQVWANNVDIISQVGKNVAYQITQPVTVSDGALNIDLSATVDAAKLGGILVTSTFEEGPGIYSWSPLASVSDGSTASPTTSPRITTVYTLTLTDNSGCVATDVVEVEVKDCSVEVVCDIVAAEIDSICPGSLVNLELASGTALQWTDLDGNLMATTQVSPKITTGYIVKGVSSTNLVQNGDFEAGNDGSFTSSYNYNPNGIGVNAWTIGNDLESYGRWFATPEQPFPDGVGGDFFFADAGSEVGASVYATQVWVEAGRDYVFSANVANVFVSGTCGGNESAPELRFAIDGQEFEEISGMTTTEQIWFDFYTLWTANVDGPVTIELLNNTGASCGNDFVLDNLVFAPVCSDTVMVVVKDCNTPCELAVDNTTICLGDSIDLSATGAELFEWVAPNGTLLGNTPRVAPSETTVYTALATATGVNMITNGDFEASNIGFTTDLTQSNVKSPNNFNTYDHEGFSDLPCVRQDVYSRVGANNVFYANVAPMANTVVYATDVVVTAGKQYVFSAWLADANNDACFENPARLQFYINGNALGEIDLVNTRDWKQFYTVWTADVDGVISIELQNINVIAEGNDLVMDGLLFAEVCEAQATIFVESFEVDFAIAPVCAGVPVTIDVTESITDVSYQWSTGEVSADIAVATVADYTVTVTRDFDGKICSDTASVSVDFFSLPKLAVPEDQFIVAGDTVLLIAEANGGNGSYTFLWQDQPQEGHEVSISPEASARYAVTVTDDNACQDTASVLVIVLPPLCHLAIRDTAVCAGQSVVISAGENWDAYNWSDGTTGASITANSAGDFFVSVTASHCTGTAIDTVQVIIHDLPDAELVDTAVCEITALALNPGSFDGYVWNDGSNGSQYDVTMSGRYSVTVMDQNRCTDTASLYVTFVGAPIIELERENVTCYQQQNGRITVNPAGDTLGLQLQWEHGSDEYHIQELGPATYQVTATNSAGCYSIATAEITEPQQMIVSTGVDQSLVCEGDEILVTGLVVGGTPGYSYLWDTGARTAQISDVPNADHIYHLSVTDVNGCRTVDNTFITVLPSPTIELGTMDYEGCAPLTVNFAVTNQQANYRYQWQFGQNNGVSSSDPDPTYTYNEPGSYEPLLVVSVDQQGCTRDSIFAQKVDVFELPTADFDLNQAVVNILQPEVTFDNLSIGAAQFRWTFEPMATSSKVHPTHVFETPGNYSVELVATSEHQCVDTAYQAVVVEDLGTFYAPNAFSPTRLDGVNDTWSPVINGLVADQYHLVVYDRWGEIVWETTDYHINPETGVPEQGWDGTIKDRPNAPKSDVYTWWCKYQLVTGEAAIKTGKVSVIF